MTNSSWLAKAKSIHDLGGHFYIPNASRPWDDKRDELAERKDTERSKRPLPVMDEFRPFYNSGMHDSAVLSIERTDAVLRVTLDCIHAEDFSVDLADSLGVPRQKGPWPVDLLLHDPRHVRAARYGPRGELRFFPWDRLGPQPDGRGTEFLYDWFHESEGRLAWIANLYVWQPHGSALSNDVSLMVDCAKATAHDRRRQGLISAYGPAAGPLWDDALADVQGHSRHGLSA